MLIPCSSVGQLLAFPQYGMLVRMVVVCFVALRYFLLVLVILIAGFSITFMLLAGALRGEAELGDVSTLKDSTNADLETGLLDQEQYQERVLSSLDPGNGTFDVIQLPVALADTFAILLGAFDHADLWDRGPMTFSCWVVYMIFGNIVMLNCAACRAADTQLRP